MAASPQTAHTQFSVACLHGAMAFPMATTLHKFCFVVQWQHRPDWQDTAFLLLGDRRCQLGEHGYCLVQQVPQEHWAAWP